MCIQAQKEIVLHSLSARTHHAHEARLNRGEIDYGPLARGLVIRLRFFYAADAYSHDTSMKPLPAMSRATAQIVSNSTSRRCYRQAPGPAAD